MRGPRADARALTSIMWSGTWRCPEHACDLVERADSLVCRSGHVIPVVGGIPRFVSSAGYADAFGAQWKRYRKTQLDSCTGLPISERRLRHALGEVLWSGLAGRSVLECGCGAGRFTEILLRQEAAVVSVDLSSAVEANIETCPVDERHAVAQADINALPLAPRQFDIVLCLGVVQHTPDPDATLRSLAEQVSPGGWLIVDHYAPELSWYTKTAPLVRRVFRHLPASTSLATCVRLVRALWPLHRLAARTRVTQALLSRVSPVLSYLRAIPELDERRQYEWALLDTHDSLTAYYRHVRTPRQISRALAELGLADIEACWGGNGVVASARRPLMPGLGGVQTT